MHALGFDLSRSLNVNVDDRRWNTTNNFLSIAKSNHVIFMHHMGKYTSQAESITLALAHPCLKWIIPIQRARSFPPKHGGVRYHYYTINGMFEICTAILQQLLCYKILIFTDITMFERSKKPFDKFHSGIYQTTREIVTYR
jgi:hypothetical protein